MEPSEITSALQEKGFRQLDVVALLKMEKTTRTIVSLVINRQARSRRVEKAISEITGLPLQKLWPEWYSPKTAKSRKVA